MPEVSLAILKACTTCQLPDLCPAMCHCAAELVVALPPNTCQAAPCKYLRASLQAPYQGTLGSQEDPGGPLCSGTSTLQVLSAHVQSQGVSGGKLAHAETEPQPCICTK